jgi:succinate dehydrogenase / fumarate reductase, cytochrome b subunit
MAVSLTRENYVMHRIHSITGVMPVGYYMVQHLVLNLNSVASPEKFNGVIDFFESFPKHLLLAVEAGMIWIPLLFHAIYGLFIVSRAENNYFTTKYKWSENRMFFLQRLSGVAVFFFLIYHVLTTTVQKYLSGNADAIKYAAMSDRFHNPLVLAAYVLGILGASYHLGYGLWNFCIRWGITVTEAAQQRIQKISAVVFVAVTLIGWGALVGFFLHDKTGENPAAPVSQSTTGTNINLTR